MSSKTGNVPNEPKLAFEHLTVKSILYVHYLAVFTSEAQILVRFALPL